VLSPALQVVAALVAFGLVGLAVIVFSSTLAHFVRHGGNVGAAHFGLPDLLTGTTLAVFFIGLMVESLRASPGDGAPVSVDQLLPAQLFIVAIVAGLSGFLLYRRLSPGRIFGLGAVSFVGVVALAFIFLFAAMPVVAITNYLSQLMLRDLADEQELVGLFRQLARAHDFPAMGKAFVATVILAPACEEFLFRGYFYGVGKRYLGALASALATSLLFAAFHLNLASLPGLFVLALCLTAAYERTGSLLVPIGIHALYNCTSLVILYLQAQGKLPWVES
jgi:membrane protease YdiL (CAAX protease family)